MRTGIDGTARAGLIAGLLLAAAVPFFAASCRGDESVAPSGPSVILLTVDPASLTLGGSTAVVKAVVKDATGNAVADNTPVVFSTTMGTVTPSSAVTTIGVATTTLSSGVIEGTAVVTATVSGLSVSVSVPFRGGSGEVGSVTVTANPDRLPADGESTSAVWARVRDGRGNLLNGVTVNFSTSLGSITASAATSDGLAKATLTASGSRGTASVLAIAKGVSGRASVVMEAVPGATPTPVPTATPTPTPVPGIGTIALVATPDVLPADGQSTSTIWATIRDTNGRLVKDGTPVNFVTTLGSITASATTTDGLAKAVLTAPRQSGTAEITAYSGGVTATVQVQVR